MLSKKRGLILFELVVLFFNYLAGSIQGPTSAKAASDPRTDAIVLVNSTSPNYLDFQHFIQPYLDYLGVPYTTLNVSTTAIPGDIGNYALIIIGHRQLDPSNSYLSSQEETTLSLAVNAGTGLVNFDNVLSTGTSPLYEYVNTIFGFGYKTPPVLSDMVFTASASHFITENHAAGDEISTGSMTLAGINLPGSATALVYAGSGTEPILAVKDYGQGHVVQWGTYNWMSHAVLGPSYGLDDLVWRSLVWAARKPFVMQGLPPFITMRLDDVSGPLDWIHIANDYGFIPWAGIFIDDFDSSEAADLSSLTNSGKASAAIHAYSTDDFFYFDHANEKNFSDTLVNNHFIEGSAWFSSHNIPKSKYLVGHYYELGSNVFAGLQNWGVEYIGTMMNPGQSEASSSWIQNGPFRLYETGSAQDLVRPVFYADYVNIPGHSEYANQFFNCVTEYRDIDDYEWHPGPDVQWSIDTGIEWLGRSLDSMELATLFTHEYDLDDTSNTQWRLMMQGISQGISGYAPLYVSMDDACQYLRAMHNSQITSGSYSVSGNSVTTSFEGTPDIPTKFYVFYEDAGTILQSMVDVPLFTGSTQVVFTLPGSLDHITVTPSSASLVSGDTQQYSAQGYDENNDPIPNLPISWSVENGGGTIDSSGLFTAGTVAGTFTNTIAAAVGEVQGAASVTVSPPAPPPDEGPNGPIIIISAAINPFTRYYTEILRAEGLNEYTASDISFITPTILAGYDVAILGEMTLSNEQVTMLTNWVNGGGNLIAMRPDPKLANLLGLTGPSSSLSDAYLLVDTSQYPGSGIVGQTIQYHGTADEYTLNGATRIARLYTAAGISTTNPAVTLRSVGSNGGQAAAFTYDLARSIVYTRQGNPDWAGQERDGLDPIRSDDLFYGDAGFDPQPDWVDLDKVAIPQADEQQRLLANLIGYMEQDRMPLPRFWYLPRGEKAAVVMTGDDHAGAYSDNRFDQFIAASPAGCSVNNWECIRETAYIYPDNSMTNSQAVSYQAQGFEISLHVNTDCADFTLASLTSDYDNQLGQFAAEYPSINDPVTERTHCIPWSDWDSQMKVQALNDIRLDTNYYFWPPSWVMDQPGLFTGSGFPMRFADLNGTMFDDYQVVTQMTDESDQTYPYTINTLLDRALGSQGYYGVFTANMHNDSLTNSDANAIVNSAKARGVPVISARQLLTWLDGRNSSSFFNIAWNTNILSFSVNIGTGANGLQVMVPTQSKVGSLTSITLNSSPVTYSTETIKGVEYAIFLAGAGNYQAIYTNGNHAPVAVNDTYTTSEDIALTVAAPGVLGNDSDADGNPLTAVQVAGPAHGAVTLSSNGAFVYTPSSNYNGSDSFTYTANDGLVNSNTASVTITINPVNDAPVITGQSPLATNEDTALTITLGDLTVTDVDNSYPTGFSLAIQTGSNYTVQGSTITPALNFNGTLTVPVRVNDGQANSNTYNLAVTVNPVNDAPVITGQNPLATNEDTDLTIALGDLVVTDVDNNYPTGFNLTVLAGTNFTIQGATITPVLNYNGSLSVPVRVNDGQANSNTFNLAVTVNPVNDAPVAMTDTYLKSDGSTLVVVAPGLLENDTDVDSSSLTAIQVTGPAHGSLTLSPDGSFTYMPAVGYNGPDSFTYKANDGSLDSNIVTVNLLENVAAGFVADLRRGSSPLMVNFINQTLPLDPGNSYLWDFGDGTTSTQVNPSHTYTSFGTYTVSLSVNGPNGEDIETKVDYIEVRHMIYLPGVVKTP